MKADVVVSLMRGVWPVAVAVVAGLAQAQSPAAHGSRAPVERWLGGHHPAGEARHRVTASTAGTTERAVARGEAGRATRDGERSPEATRPARVASAATAMGVAAPSAWGQAGMAATAAGGAALAILVSVLGWLAWRRMRRPVDEGAGGGRRGPLPRARSSFASGEYEPMTLAPETSVHYGAGGIEEIASRTGEFRWGVPQGFDAAGFVTEARRNFVVLQDAWDAADLGRLRALMTDELFDNIQAQLRERGDRPNRTDVVTLHAELLGVEQLAGRYLANIEFSGMIREEVSAGASPFREIWTLTKPADGSAGWLLAGVQALQ